MTWAWLVRRTGKYCSIRHIEYPEFQTGLCFFPPGLCSLRVLSIMPKIPEILVGIEMERFVSVSSDQKIRDYLWRWSRYFGRNIPTETRRSIYDKPVLCPNLGIR